jgi:hypothetical protein
MTKPNPYASEAETLSLLQRDKRSMAEITVDRMVDELGAWEQGAEPFVVARQIAVALLEEVKASNYKRTEAWLKACGKAPPDIEGLSVQIGCHLEEFCEFLGALRSDSEMFFVLQKSYPLNQLKIYLFGKLNYPLSLMCQHLL